MLLQPKKSYSQVFIFANNSQDDERKFLNWAENELRLAGLLDGGDPYGGMISNGIMEMLEVWHKQGHSGMSAGITRDILHKILNWENLTPLTDNPTEWQDIEELMQGGWGDGKKHYQSKRNPACFTDDFKQYYNVDDEARKMYNLQTANLEASKKMTEQEEMDYFKFLIDHTACELQDMLKTEKDPEKLEIIKETIAEANARNMKCEASGLITMSEARAMHGEHCVKLHCVKCGDTITCRCSAPKVEIDGICGKCEIKGADKEEKPPKKDTKKYWKEMALYDNLTDLPNRNAFDLTIEDQKDEFGWIGIFDIDHFKKINDEYGHDAGDNALKTLANFLHDKVLVFRWGGEEFVFLVPKSNPEEVEALLNEIREEVKTLTFEEGFTISVSVGLAPYDYNQDVDEQFKNADKALYCAKEGGRDMVVMYEDGMDCTAHTEGKEGIVKNEECEVSPEGEQVEGAFNKTKMSSKAREIYDMLNSGEYEISEQALDAYIKAYEEVSDLINKDEIEEADRGRELAHQYLIECIRDDNTWDDSIDTYSMDFRDAVHEYAMQFIEE